MKLILNFSILALLCVFAASCGKKNQAIIHTEYGDIKVRLYDEDAPKHTENFMKLVDEKFYDSLLFHRVIPNFMIQGGDPSSKNAPSGQRLGGGDPGYKIDAEIGRKHFRGVLAAARDRNPQKRSSGSQFYIVVGRKVDDAFLNRVEKQNNIKYTEEERAKYKEVGGVPFLDGEYTVFGEVIEGMDAVDKIVSQKTDASDRPVEDVKMVIRK